MLSESKQNIFDLQKPSTSQSTRRYSTYSTSACKQMLKSICEDSQFLHQKHSRGDSSVRQIKLKEAIAFLQKKNAKQTEQITMLTQDLNSLTKLRQQQLKGLEQEMDRIRKNQAEKSSNIKVVNDLKKRILQLQGNNTGLRNKNTQIQKRFVKLKEILRKKQISISQLQAKLDTNKNLQNILNKQKQQLSTLRQNFIRIKQKQAQLQDQNQIFRAKISQLKRQNHEYKSQQWGLQQSNKRLQQQCEQLQKHYQQSRKQSQQIQTQLKHTIQQQNKQMKRLRQTIQKIQHIEQDNKNNQFVEVYKEQISQILKQSIVDRSVRNKVERAIHQIVASMEESMNRVLVHIVANNL